MRARVSVISLLFLWMALQCLKAYGLENVTCSTTRNAYPTCVASPDRLLVLECPNATDQLSSVAWTKSRLDSPHFETIANCSPHHPTCVVNPSRPLHLDDSGSYCCEQNHTQSCLKLRVNAPPYLLNVSECHRSSVHNTTTCAQLEKVITVHVQESLKLSLSAYTFEKGDVTWQLNGVDLVCGTSEDNCTITMADFNGTYFFQELLLYNLDYFCPDEDYVYSAFMRNEFGLNITTIALTVDCEWIPRSPGSDKTVADMQVKRGHSAHFNCPIKTSRDDDTLVLGVSYSYWNATLMHTMNVICEPGSYGDNICHYGNFSSNYTWTANKTRKSLTCCDYTTFTNFELLIDGNISSHFTIDCFWMNNTEFVTFHSYNVTAVSDDNWVGSHWYAVAAPAVVLIIAIVSLALGVKMYRRRCRTTAGNPDPPIIVITPEHEERRPLVMHTPPDDEVDNVYQYRTFAGWLEAVQHTNSSQASSIHSSDLPTTPLSDVSEEADDGRVPIAKPDKHKSV